MNILNPNMGLTDSQREKFLMMLIHRGEKQAGYRVHLLERWFPITRLKCSAIIGSFSMTSTATKQRWMLESLTSEYDGIYMTPADIARDYITVKYGGKRRRITTAQYQNFYHIHRQAPVYANPCHIEHGCYVDIKSAYWNILRAFGWDVEYMPGQWVSCQSDVSDFPFPDNKLARNCLVSVGSNPRGNMKLWTGSEIVFKRTGNALVNMMLFALVMDVLNGIAVECINAGAVYAYTDGFIVEADKAALIQDIISSWGYPSSIKFEGVTHVKAAGNYRVGDIYSKHYRHKVKEHYHSKLDTSVNIQWLKKRSQFFAEKSNRIIS